MLPLRFLSAMDRIVLVCEGTHRPKVGDRVRATGSEGNGLLVVDVIEHLPKFAKSPAHCFGLRLRTTDVPWPPDTLIEIVSGKNDQSEA